MMYYVFLVGSLLIAVAGLALRRRSDSLSRALLVGGCVGCLACLGWQVRESLFTPPAKGPDRGQAVVAYFLANEFLRQSGSQPGTVVLVFPPDSVISEESRGVFAGTFSRVLRGFPEFKVQIVVLSLPDKAARAGNIPLKAFQQAVTNYPTATAYVSFAGVPGDIGEFTPPERRPGPGFFVFDPWGTTNWLSALRKGNVRTAIVPRPGVARDGEVSGEPNAIFERLYLMATPATADRIASELGAR